MVDGDGQMDRQKDRLIDQQERWLEMDRQKDRLIDRQNKSMNGQRDTQVDGGQIGGQIDR